MHGFYRVGQYFSIAWNFFVTLLFVNWYFHMEIGYPQVSLSHRCGSHSLFMWGELCGNIIFPCGIISFLLWLLNTCTNFAYKNCFDHMEIMLSGYLLKMCRKVHEKLLDSYLQFVICKLYMHFYTDGTSWPCWLQC